MLISLENRSDVVLLVTLEVSSTTEAFLHSGGIVGATVGKFVGVVVGMAVGASVGSWVGARVDLCHLSLAESSSALAYKTKQDQKHSI